MKPTKDGRGFLIYRCRNCGEEFYSELIEPKENAPQSTVDSIFLDILMYSARADQRISHSCSYERTGVGDLIGYKGFSEEEEKITEEKNKKISNIIRKINDFKKEDTIIETLEGPPARVSFKEEEKHRWKNWFERLKKKQEEQDKIKHTDKCDE